MGSGNKTQKSTQTQTSGPSQDIQDAFRSILNQAQNVAQTPYNTATNQQVAGFTDAQNQAFQGVQNALGSYQPYLQSAAGQVASGVAPVTMQSILDNYNPFVQSQVDALQQNLNQQNAQTLQGVNSNAAKIGALTGDRSQIAAQQAMNDNNRNAATAMANLQSQAFGQAANLAQGNQQAALQGASLYGNLANQTQQLGYNDINALLGIGGLQQQNAQAGLDAATANAQAQAAYPFQTTQWLSGIASGLLPGFGQTSTGTTTTPGPNMYSQLLGAGVAAASLASDARVKDKIAEVGKLYDGTPVYRFNYKGDPATRIGVMAQDVERRRPEAVSQRPDGVKMVNHDLATRSSAQKGHYAGGGGIPYEGSRSYVPEISLSGSRGFAPGPSLMQASQPSSSNGMEDLLSSFKQAKGAFEGMGNLGTMMRTSTDPASGWSTTVNPSSLSGWGNYLGNVFGFRSGGGVKGYQDGGDVYGFEDDDSDYGLSFGDGSEMTGNVPDLWSSSGVAPAGSAPVTPHPIGASASPKSGSGLFGLSDAARQGLLMAGLGMMASKSPFIGTAIGEGGLAGAQTYEQAKRADEAKRLKEQSIGMSAARLQQAAQIAAENLKLRTRQADALEGWRGAQTQELKSRQDARAKRAAIQDTILKMIGPDAGASVTAPPTSSIQPQSYNAPAAGPGVQNVADVTSTQGPAAETEAAPSPIQTVADNDVPSSAPAASPDVITTPFGPMPREKALKLGGAMLLDPQTAAAGKALVDLAQQPVNPALGKEAVNKLQEKQLNTTEAYARLSNIEAGFKPQFQTIENRLGNKWSEWMDSFDTTRKTLTPQQKQELGEFSAFRADAINNLNQYIKEITGAAMTNAEAARIMQAMPNPGDSVFNGDSPTVFKAKLDAALKNSRLALARYNYLAKNGFQGSVDEMSKRVPLEKMQGIIQERANKLLQDALSQNKGLDQQDVLPIVRQRLRAEFGMEI